MNESRATEMLEADPAPHRTTPWERERNHCLNARAQKRLTLVWIGVLVAFVTLSLASELGERLALWIAQ